MEKTMLFQELRSVREARHISLSQISEATRIGVQFLEAIEQGNTSDPAVNRARLLMS